MYYQRRTTTGLVDDEIMTLSTELMIAEAKSLGAEVEIIPNTKFIRVTHQGKTVFFRGQTHPLTSHLAYLACKDKETTKVLLAQHGVSVPKGYLVKPNDSFVEKKAVFDRLKKPLVIKPAAGQHGDEVFPNVSTEVEYLNALTQISSSPTYKNSACLVEEMFIGQEYRVLATREKVIGVINRVPANVIGDGSSTIEQLIAAKNADPRRKDTYEGALLKIKVDEHVIATLEALRLTLNSIPRAGEKLYLRSNSNLSTGGDSIDMTDLVHPSVKEIALTAINALPDLPVAGLDFLSSDITQDQNSTTYVILEVNATPMLVMHDQPFEGVNRHAIQEFILLALNNKTQKL